MLQYCTVYLGRVKGEYSTGKGGWVWLLIKSSQAKSAFQIYIAL